jgi:hypothetical protein
MNLHELLKKLRLRSSEREDEVEAMEEIDTRAIDAMAGYGGDAPTSWVPSQQDERPRH